MIPDWQERLLTCYIENHDALHVIKQWDRPETLFYVDPPYVHDTRKTKGDYVFEMDDDAHIKLVDTLLDVKGMVVLSAYKHPIYDRLAEAGWQFHERETVSWAQKSSASSRDKRTECIWQNPAACEKQYADSLRLETK